jgi:hypothetical protein
MSKLESIVTADTKLAADLMAAIFQATDHIFLEKGDVTEQYLKHCASDIDRLGRLLKFLGLAEDDKDGVFGWKPTAKLISLIAERAARPAKGSDKRATARERAVVGSLLQLAGGWVEPTYTDDFVFRALNSLGLLRETVYGECKPTALLKEVLENVVDNLTP